jgi:hypothetical protein
MYLIGLVFGMVVFSLTFLFKKMPENKRVLTVFISGIVIVLGSILLVGGFEGMPFGMIGLGMSSTAVILFFFQNHLFKNKRVLISILFGAVILAAGAIYLNKPDRKDFVIWLEDTYEVTCMDPECSKLKLNGTSNQKEENLFWDAEGYYDTSEGFLNSGMQMKRLYRNIDDFNQSFSVEVKGFFGEFTEMDFQQNKVTVLRKDQEPTK